MSGGGHNPVSDVANTISKGVQATGNFFGFDNSGKWTNQGGIFKWGDEGIGQLTGRNQARAALNFAKDQYHDSQVQADRVLAQQRWNQQQGDILASNSAAAATATGKAGGGINYSNATPMAMGPGGGASAAPKDFLGL